MERYPQSTLFFDTLRTGFPTARIWICDNKSLQEASRRIFNQCEIKGFTYSQVKARRTHAQWIGQVINGHSGQLVILDGDTIFWENCEWFDFETILAGYYVPSIFNEYAQCMSVPRLHTSFLWIKDTMLLRQAIEDVYPIKNPQPIDIQYAPFDEFANRIQFIGGKPMFYDGCANLYQALGGSKFEESHLDCYDHLNCATFCDVMLTRMKNPDGLRELHDLAISNPSALRGMWRGMNDYYERVRMPEYA